MSRSDQKRRPALPDRHLWTAVAETVSPLNHKRLKLMQLADEALPLPAPPSPRPKKLKLSPPKPAYQSAGKPGKPPATGIEPRLKRRLGRGQVDIDGTLDLHGMRQAEAYGALNRFIQARARRGERTVLVITGKGLKKLGSDAAIIIERGVLRAMLPIWLSEPGLAPLVSGWDAAAQGHGGEGAFYVRLKRPRDER